MTDTETRRWAVALVQRVMGSSPVVVLAANAYMSQGGARGDWPVVWAEVQRLVREMGEAKPC